MPVSPARTGILSNADIINTRIDLITQGGPMLKRAPVVLFLALALALGPPSRVVPAAPAPQPLDLVISELAWMGTTTGYTDEWIELHNPTAGRIDLSGWTLAAADDSPAIHLSGTVPAGGYFLLERGDDATLPTLAADQLYTGSLSDAGEILTLSDGTRTIDRVDCAAGWYAGHGEGRVPMVRVSPTVSGSLASNWTYNPRCGDPTNSAGISHTCALTVTTVGRPLAYSVYFNHRFTATATTPALQPMEQALIDLIDGAGSTVDVALYGLNRSRVITALLDAHGRGLAVRVVGDDEAAGGDYAPGYQALLQAGITVVTDTAGAIQHNKFVVVDGETVWTGSTNFTDTGLTLNANNAISIGSPTLAGVYTAEFEEMWAGAFHGSKLDNTPHLFDFQGTRVESYFSPTDLPAFEVWDALAEAQESVHFAMFYWTDDILAQRTVERLADGVEVLGVWDQLGAANNYSDDEALCAAGARIKIEDFEGKTHHKFAVIDVDGPDPVVILGSYNWTSAGAYDNDENTLIIHDAALARAYYAEWSRLWSAIPLDRTCNPHTTHLPLMVHDPAAGPAGVGITHVEYDPPGDDVQGEYVRLENSGGTAADLTGWTLRDEANHVYTFPAFTLDAGASVEVWTGSGTDTAGALYWGRSSAVWNNSGDCAILRDAGGTEVDRVCY
jgi:phosphatidylserine/phosphatidylglycerophosphate/cardiolipin synthase-like enzyme